MSEKSFYDLDFIIEINEHRLEQYTTAYQKVMERLTHIILIYSGITIFLIPLVEDGALFRIRSPVFLTFLLLFLGLLIVSLGYTVRLIIPVRIAYLGFPQKYYDGIRLKYESSIKERKVVNDLIKASYVRELQETLETTEKRLKVKESFQNRAVVFALLSIVPYIICLGFHLSQSQGKTISNTKKSSNFMEIISVSKQKEDKKINEEIPEKPGAIPGVDNSLIIPSHPIYRLETSSRSYTFDEKGNKVYIK